MLKTGACLILVLFYVYALFGTCLIQVACLIEVAARTGFFWNIFRRRSQFGRPLSSKDANKNAQKLSPFVINVEIIAL